MKILKKGIKKVYEIDCPECGSKLEADTNEVKEKFIDYEFYCPVCERTRIVSPISVNKKFIYEDQDEINVKDLLDELLDELDEPLI